MSAQCSVMVAARVTELGENIDLRQKFDTETPDNAIHSYKTLATADTPEMLPLGGIAVSVCDGILFKAIGDEFWIDTCVSDGGSATDFVNKLRVPEGKAVFFSPPQANPVTSIAILASTAAAYEYVMVGRTS